MIISGLYVIIQPDLHPAYSPVELAGFALQGGADVIQWRDKSGDTEMGWQMAKAIAKLCQPYKKPFIINDNVELALDVGADGVHLGQDDLPIGAARKLLGPGKIIGGSAGTSERARALCEAGVNYIGAGHVFPTQTKQKTTPPIGVDGLRAVCDAVDVPVIAIGGISEDNMPALFEAGAAGMAVVSAVCAAEDPLKATQILKRKFEDNG